VPVISNFSYNYFPKSSVTYKKIPTSLYMWTHLLTCILQHTIWQRISLTIFH